jgi:mannose-1-phosphate guanylyltransferase/mannose-6-phosphate isomerase
MLIPVILSGGSGTRLWPLSRELYPKQLLPLVSERTLLEDTALRLRGLPNLGAPIVVCNDAHRFMVAEQLRRIATTPRSIVLEPVGRNTAPAVAVAALTALKAEANADPILLVLPADHVIEDVPAFHVAIGIALTEAAAGRLVTFGIVARTAETGYGYIRRAGGKGPAYPVAQFIEKPDAKRARQFVDSGEYFWNSGMFVFKASRYLEELKRLAPDMLEACEKAVAAARVDLEFTRLAREEFERCPSESIDYAVMEKTRDAVVVPLDAGWSDVGSWAALHEASRTDGAGNVTRGDVIAEDTHDCFLYSDSRLVATVGLGDHVVVETKDAVLVAPKSRVQDVKLLVNRLKENQRGEVALHREVFRPWGSYDSLDSGERFQVKRLTINPGASISLQLHNHRAEHWVVVAGTARITRGDDVFLLEENQSTYIPVRTRHRIENPGKVPLHIIEVQSGSYLGEDDIVRFEDVYGRQGTNT